MYLIKFDLERFKSEKIAIKSDDKQNMKWLFDNFAPMTFKNIPIGCVEITLNDSGEFGWMDDHEYYRPTHLNG
jgi:hypothetical protein